MESWRGGGQRGKRERGRDCGDSPSVGKNVAALRQRRRESIVHEGNNEWGFRVLLRTYRLNWGQDNLLRMVR